MPFFLIFAHKTDMSAPHFAGATFAIRRACMESNKLVKHLRQGVSAAEKNTCDWEKGIIFACIPKAVRRSFWTFLGF